ncbi:hypothetical protein F2Q68_00035538 [Brassica cretica]|uniref:Uncharacterized protein n=1 Tax=Brassica cretica TaxID=69181 RepID=A0A8S9H134_BRACR|nr:hypothetical protein F2Q68_00035538 [Brassica cretica]
MSVAQSERNVTEGSSSFLASVIPLWRASDSAMRGELTSSMMLVPVERDPNCSLVKRQVIPARFDEASQAASTKQQSVWGSLGDCRWVDLTCKASLPLERDQQIHESTGALMPVDFFE